MKKTLILLLILFFPLTIIIPQICTATNTTFASTQQESINQEEIEESIEEEINNQLDNLDFSNLDDILNSFNENQSNLFNGKNFLEKSRMRKQVVVLTLNCVSAAATDVSI